MGIRAAELQGRVSLEGVDRSTRDLTGFGKLFDRIGAQITRSGSVMGRGLETAGRAVTSLAKAGALAASGGIVALGAGFVGASTSGLRFNSSMEQVTARLNAFTKDGAATADILEMIRERAAA